MLQLPPGTSVPLPGYDKEHTADPQVGEEDVHPNVGRERVEEGEHAGVGPVGLPVQDADPQGHEGLGEIDGFLPDMSDGERSHGQVSFLQTAQREGTQAGRKEELQTEVFPSPWRHHSSHTAETGQNAPKCSPGAPPSCCTYSTYLL